MSTHTPTDAPIEVEYPDSDGKRMSDNTLQFRWIVTIQGVLDAVFADDPDVFVGGDLLWYPARGSNKIRQAPDALVAFGRPKGYRGSYLQWLEADIAPQVVFEVLSPKNRRREMDRKRDWYFRHGIEEYYEFDPARVQLRGAIRQGGPIREVEAMSGWVSPRLGVRFELADDLTILGPDGRPFASYLEVIRQRDESERVAEREGRRAEREGRRADLERRRADLERRRAEQERERADLERRRAERLEARLRELGLEPEE